MMSSMTNGIVATYAQPKESSRRVTIPELLFARQQYGLKHHAKRSKVTVTELASRIAWNPSRMRNMTLCVGPGTPASVCMARASSSSSSSSTAGDSNEDEDSNDENDSEDSDNEDDYDDDDDDDDEEHKEEREDKEQIHHDDSDCEEHSDDDDSQWLQRQEGSSITRSHAERSFMDWIDDDSDGDIEDDEDDDDDELIDPSVVGISRYVPSLRHGGCINTAAWLTSPWRVSTCGSSSNNGRGNGQEEFSTLPSDDCPTQLITSGDDRQVKFWDARHAIGTSNPLAGGKNTVCPFSSEVPQEAPVDAWRDFHSKSVIALSGSVVPLATVYTRHHGNVFHVTPLDHDPGKVVTCGADGYLRCADLTSQTSTIIVSPEFDLGDEDTSPRGLMSRRSGMCFSHHFVDANTGLLCGERGLRRFDIRVNPREQQMRSVLSSDTCKACAIWSKGSADSAYVFAGGTSADVALYDLRMVSDGGPPSKKVQLYRPRGLSEDAKVSVSGIDISKNKRELLISYENDQIYTFPICPKSASAAGPTVDELTDLSSNMEEEGTVQNELCAYGGHLNRYTFLKNAKYAGPNDEYICTGSDSGHAWIYNKYNGSVVSFLNADHSTCNGVIPHPTLPLFVTYGIDSTAKLWRASTPVDSEVDDSPTGRSRFYNENKHYSRTPLVSSWSYCKEKLSILSDVEDDAICVMPDEIPSTADMCDRGLFGGLSSIFFRNRRRGESVGQGDGGPFIGNDLHNLAGVLRQNLFSCILAHESDDDEPVRSSLNELKRRMSVIRLNHNAARKGLILDPDIPWQLKAAQCHSQLKRTESKQRSLVRYGDPVDLIPDSPCDWIPYDPEMTGNALDCGPNFNVKDYEDFYRQYYSGPQALRAKSANAAQCLHRNKRKLNSQEAGEAITITNGPDAELGAQLRAAVAFKAVSVTTETEKSQTGSSVSKSSLSSDEEEGTTTLTESIETSRSLKVLHDTVLLLKEAGNTAQKAGLPSLAARRYDQALQYCAIVFLEFPRGDLDIYAARANNSNGNNGSDDVASLNPRRLQWSPLLKLLIVTRLNLSMVLLKLPYNPEPKKAADLAMTALFELGPFVMQQGQIRKGRKYVEVHKRDEAHETYRVAKELQAKGYFRLGSAQCDMGNHGDAVKSFEHSIRSTKAMNSGRGGSGGEPEIIVLRRLAEAKRASERKNKRQRRKLNAAMFGVCDEAGTPANSSSAECEDGQKEKATSGEEGKQEGE